VLDAVALGWILQVRLSDVEQKATATEAFVPFDIAVVRATMPSNAVTSAQEAEQTNDPSAGSVLAAARPVDSLARRVVVPSRAESWCRHRGAWRCGHWSHASPSGW
jgi:hypothetical protein